MTDEEESLPELDALALAVKAAVVQQALEDPDYRELALNDPREAVRRNRILGRLPGLAGSELRFRVVEEAPQLLYLVVPHRGSPRSPDPDSAEDVVLRKAMADPA